MRQVLGFWVTVLGILALGAFMPRSASAINIVSNGGFETGDFSGWSITDPINMRVATGDLNHPPHSGASNAILGTVGGLGFLSQTLITVPGTRYDLSYWLANNPDCCPNHFQVSWNGSIIADATCATSSSCFGFPYHQFTDNDLLATGSSTVLQFGAQQDPDFFSLDDVSVEATPEPSTWALAIPGMVPFALGYLRRRGRTTRLPLGV
jgi:hypothetical protein